MISRLNSKIIIVKYEMMFANCKTIQWTPQYLSHIDRNIGPITYKEQERLRKTPIAIFGTGGLGGPLAELLVRSGCQNLIICDCDVFDKSNLNRQVCTIQDLGKYKVDILEQYLLKIDPELQIQKYYNISVSNISKLLKTPKIVALTLDDPIISIFIARECKKRGISVVEGWGVPLLWSWWFIPQSMDYEQCFGLNTTDLTFEELRKAPKIVYNCLIKKIFALPGIQAKYDREPEMFDRMMKGQIAIRSFAPFVRLTANMLAVDIIFAGILNLKEKVLAPNIVGYDYIWMRQIKTTL